MSGPPMERPEALPPPRPDLKFHQTNPGERQGVEPNTPDAWNRVTWGRKAGLESGDEARIQIGLEGFTDPQEEDQFENFSTALADDRVDPLLKVTAWVPPGELYELRRQDLQGIITWTDSTVWELPFTR